MNYNSNSWHIVLVDGSNKYLMNRWLISGEYLFRYHIFPELVTREMAKVQTPGLSDIKMTPVFLQATIDDIGDYASDSEYDIAVILPRNLKPIDDRTMRLAIYVSGIRPSEVTISPNSIEKIIRKSKPSYEVFGTAGSFQGYRTIIDNQRCFCIPFGSNTLVIKEHK